MFGSLGFPEIIFILVLALLVFGPKKLPEVGRTIGGALREFRRATGDLKRTFDQEVNLDPVPTKPEAAEPAFAEPEPQPEPESEPEAEPEAEAVPSESSSPSTAEEDSPS